MLLLRLVLGKCCRNKLGGALELIEDSRSTRRNRRNLYSGILVNSCRVLGRRGLFSFLISWLLSKFKHKYKSDKKNILKLNA